jgi:hypothetical protein
VSTILFHSSEGLRDLDLHTAFQGRIALFRRLNDELRNEFEAALEDERQLASRTGNAPQEPGLEKEGGNTRPGQTSRRHDQVRGVVQSDTPREGSSGLGWSDVQTDCRHRTGFRLTAR